MAKGRARGGARDAARGGGGALPDGGWGVQFTVTPVTCLLWSQETEAARADPPRTGSPLLSRLRASAGVAPKLLLPVESAAAATAAAASASLAGPAAAPASAATAGSSGGATVPADHPLASLPPFFRLSSAALAAALDEVARPPPNSSNPMMGGGGGGGAMLAAARRGSSPCLLWGCWLLAYLLQGGLAHGHLARGLLHNGRAVSALLDYLRTTGAPAKDRVLALLHGLLSSGEHLLLSPAHIDYPSSGTAAAVAKLSKDCNMARAANIPVPMPAKDSREEAELLQRLTAVPLRSVDMLRELLNARLREASAAASKWAAFFPPRTMQRLVELAAVADAAIRRARVQMHILAATGGAPYLATFGAAATTPLGTAPPIATGEDPLEAAASVAMASPLTLTLSNSLHPDGRAALALSARGDATVPLAPYAMPGASSGGSPPPPTAWRPPLVATMPPSLERGALNVSQALVHLRELLTALLTRRRLPDAWVSFALIVSARKGGVGGPAPAGSSAAAATPPPTAAELAVLISQERLAWAHWSLGTFDARYRGAAADEAVGAWLTRCAAKAGRASSLEVVPAECDVGEADVASFPVLGAIPLPELRLRAGLLIALNVLLCRCLSYIDLTATGIGRGPGGAAAGGVGAAVSVVVDAAAVSAAGGVGGGASAARVHAQPIPAGTALTLPAVAAALSFSPPPGHTAHLLPVGAMLRRLQHLVLVDAKEGLIAQAIEASESAGPCGLKVSLDNRAHLASAERGLVEPSLSQCTFAQWYRAMVESRVADRQLRHRLSDKEFLFEVSWVGLSGAAEEGIDWGGIYRDTLTRMMDDLFGSGSAAAGGGAGGGADAGGGVGGGSAGGGGAAASALSLCGGGVDLFMLTPNAAALKASEEAAAEIARLTASASAAAAGGPGAGGAAGGSAAAGGAGADGAAVPIPPASSSGAEGSFLPSPRYCPAGPGTTAALAVYAAVAGSLAASAVPAVAGGVGAEAAVAAGGASPAPAGGAGAAGVGAGAGAAGGAAGASAGGASAVAAAVASVLRSPAQASSAMAISMLEWVGRLMGVSVRTKATLDFDLAPLAWKLIAEGEDACPAAFAPPAAAAAATAAAAAAVSGASNGAALAVSLTSPAAGGAGAGAGASAAQSSTSGAGASGGGGSSSITVEDIAAVDAPLGAFLAAIKSFAFAPRGSGGARGSSGGSAASSSSGGGAASSSGDAAAAGGDEDDAVDADGAFRAAFGALVWTMPAPLLTERDAALLSTPLPGLAAALGGGSLRPQGGSAGVVDAAAGAGGEGAIGAAGAGAGGGSGAIGGVGAVGGAVAGAGGAAGGDASIASILGVLPAGTPAQLKAVAPRGAAAAGLPPFASVPQVLSAPLLPGGASQPVTYAARQIYVDAVIAAFVRRYVPACAAIRRGLAGIIPDRALRLCRWMDLQRLACGESEIDIAVLRRNSAYDSRGIFHDDHPTIRWFWQCMESLSPEQKRNFVRYAWGRSKLPRGAWPRNYRGEQVKFKLVPKQGWAGLPLSHTCFFLLELGTGYTSYEHLRRSIVTALTYGANEGFHIA